MFQKAIFFFLFAFLGVGPVFSSQDIRMNDIPKVMERLFNFHIENKELSTTLVRRSMKIYIEQFDPDKAYLLESEVLPFLSMTETTAKQILSRLKQNDYSDFIALNQVMQQAVLRAQTNRAFIASDLIYEQDLEPSSAPFPSQFANSSQQLIERQKNRMVRFYLYHKSRTALDTLERRTKVFSLFEKKVRRGENNYLFLTADGEPMARNKVENQISVRILKCLAKSLDTHTAFFSPEEAVEMRMSLEKQFEGVGVVLSEGIDGVMIAELIKGSPAEVSGQIQVNDLLIEVDGKQTAQLPFEEVLELLKNKDKREIVLGFKRSDLEANREAQFYVSLKKRPIVMNEERIETSYEQFADGIIGKITLHSFYESADGYTSEKDIKEAIRKFREKGNLKALVLDLRENSGGFLTQAVKVAGLFVSNGVVVISKYGQGEVHYLRNIVGQTTFNGPLVILTSKMSASAAEIVAQALQDYGVGLVVGDQRTFGKGSIQFQTVTDEKADLFFKVTVGRYYTVSGKSTQIDGVIADIVVPTQYAPYNIGEKYLEYPLPPDHVDAAYIDPLSDLDEKTKKLFEKRYMPYLQRVVSYWQKMLPTLRKNSTYRLSKNPAFQALLKKQEKVKARVDTLPVNSVDEPVQATMNDLQMEEAVNILKDMVQMDAQSNPKELLQTGTD